MKNYVVEDGSGERYEVEAETPKAAVHEACPDAVHVELLYWDQTQVYSFALFDEESEHYDDVQVWEAGTQE